MSDSDADDDVKNNKKKVKKKGSGILGHIRRASGKLGITESSEDLLGQEAEAPRAQTSPQVRPRKGSWLKHSSDRVEEPKEAEGKKKQKKGNRDTIDRPDEDDLDVLEQILEEEGCSVDDEGDKEAGPRKTKAKSAPDLTRAQKMELMMCKLQDLGSAASQMQPKKRNALQKLLSKLSEEQAEEDPQESMRAYRQLNNEIQSLSQELALSPRGSHASPIVSLKALKVLGMMNDLDLPAPARPPQESSHRSASFSAPTNPIAVHPRTKSMSAAGPVSMDADPVPHARPAGLPLKAIKMLGVMEPPTIEQKKAKTKVQGEDVTASPHVEFERRNPRSRSNSSDESTSSQDGSSSDRSDSSGSGSWVTRVRARTLSKEQVEAGSKSPLMGDRRERRARTMSKGNYHEAS